MLSIFMLVLPEAASASTYVAQPSAQLAQQRTRDRDYRVATLAKFLKEYGSPLTPYSYDFVRFADTYNLDWRLVPAITGVESTFGKRIPTNSYNAYGWANGAYSFNSWEEGIEVVSKTLREDYINRGAKSLNKIARRYAPPSSTWAWKVNYFMRKIDPLSLTFTI